MKSYEIFELLENCEVEGIKVYHSLTGKVAEGKGRHVARWCIELGYSYGEDSNSFYLLNGYKLV